MSVIGVIIAIVGLVVSLLAGLFGLLGGIPAVVLGLLAVLFGVLARKNSKGIPAIVLGLLAVILAVVLTVNGISSAKFQLDRVKASPEKAPILAGYADKARPELGFLGLVMVTENQEEITAITNEVKALIEGTEPKAPAVTAAPEAPEAEPAG